MPERTVISPHFSWRVDGVPRTVFRGAIIDIPEDVAARGDALNCFLETRVEYPSSGEEVTPGPEPDLTEQSPPETHAPKRRAPRKRSAAQATDPAA